MSRYIRLLNGVKRDIASLQLTASQAACRDRIEERLAYPGVVNLCGHSGSGKTFLAWSMSAFGRGVLLPDSGEAPFTLADTQKIVYVDNASAERGAFRRLTSVLESAGAMRAVIVTREPADDYVFRAELGLTDADVAIASRNLDSIGFRTSARRFSTLWHLALQAALEG